MSRKPPGTLGDQRPIAIVSPRYPPAIGGVERHAEALARGLRARGVAVEVLTTDPGGDLPPLVDRDGVIVHRFPTLRGDDVYYASPRLLRWAWQHADRYRLIHAHGYHTLVPLAAWMGSARHGVPFVVTPHYHGSGHTPLRRLLHMPYRPVGAAVLRAADRVLANSAAERGWLERDVAGLSAFVIPPGIDLPPDPNRAGAAAPRLERRADEVTLLAVGRLLDYKQVDRIVTALPHLGPEVALTIIGDGPAAPAIMAAAERLGVAGRVRLRGHVSGDELRAWYGVAAAFVSLSLDEAFGLTVLEAAAAGAPVLASDIPAHRESVGYVAPGRISLVHPTADGPALAAALTRALSQGRSTDRTGWHLPTWDGLVDGVLAAYRDVLAD